MAPTASGFGQAPYSYRCRSTVGKASFTSTWVLASVLRSATDTRGSVAYFFIATAGLLVLTRSEEGSDF